MSKKILYSLCALLSMMQFASAEVNYHVYSEEYSNCMKNASQSGNYETCYQNEYYDLKRQLKEIKQKIAQVSDFKEYNLSDKSILTNVEDMEKYMELYCEYMQYASNRQQSMFECRMKQLNFIYVDLYKLYEAAISKNKPKSFLN